MESQFIASQNFGELNFNGKQDFIKCEVSWLVNACNGDLCQVVQVMDALNGGMHLLVGHTCWQNGLLLQVEGSCLAQD